MAPRVSVILATYNCAPMLRCAIRSVLQQSLPDFELLVIGDGCTDGSAAVVQSCGDPRVSWTNLARNHGSQGAANNEGLARAAGRYIAYLGQDDLWFPAHLATLVSQIETTGADFVHALGVWIERDGPATLLAPHPAGPLAAPLHHHPAPSTWLHRADLVGAVGAWSDHRRVPCGIDEDYFRRVARAGKAIAFSPELTVLKFRAAAFKPYAFVGPPPQDTYLRDITRDPAGAQRAVLTQVALAYFRRPPLGSATLPTMIGRAGRGAGRYVWRRVVAIYGADRWPVSRWRLAAYQRGRRKALARKGLPDAMIRRTTRADPET